MAGGRMNARVMVNFFEPVVPSRSTYTSTSVSGSPRRRSTASFNVMFIVDSLLIRTM